MIVKSFLIEKDIASLDQKIVLFYGENHGLKNDLKFSLIKTYKECNFFNLQNDDILKNLNNFFSEINNFSLFEKEKIFFIDSINEKFLKVIEEINLENTRKIYLFAGNLDKKSKIRNYFEKSKQFGAVACYNDNEIGIKKIILNKLNGYKGLTSQNINIIADNCNLDRIKLNNEIEKIKLYFNDKILETNKLELLLNTKVNDNFNTLKDEALLGNKILTNKLLGDTLMDDDKNVLYLNLINQRLNKLAETAILKKNSTAENAINTIRPPVFWKDKPILLAQTRKWDLHKIKNMLNETYNLEVEIKSNASVSKNILMKKLILNICCLANV